MQIDISGRHKFTVTDMLRDYVDEKMPKLDRFALKIETAHVIFEAEKVNQTCEIVLLGKNLRLTACETTTAMQASFDAALGNLMHQLERYHEKLKQHRHERIQVESVTPDEDES
ncbi:MAG: ribosome-associated translation inhibitor RaiA [Candidatus Omnitrophica bacterium]|jgi:putative sigma-54 modulation protein|nr:ribosome-associated translation inhibitor RaiA [Candidatus Omnitrophota bacterium]